MLLNINDVQFNVKTLITEKDKSTGMMNKKFDNPNDGLLFICEPKQQSFWMKNCIIPLDIIMINNRKINKIHHNCPPCETDKCRRYMGYGSVVLELQGGTCSKLEIKEGDKISF